MTAGSPTPADPPLPYREVTEPNYAQQVAQTFTLEKPHAGITILRGNCPRCDALLELPVVDTMFQGMRTVSDLFHRRWTTSPADDHVEPMICLCEDEHPGRPEGRTGCGAYWTLLVPRARP